MFRENIILSDPVFLFLLLRVDSECGVWSGGVAALLPSGLSSVSQPQLRGSPGRRGGWSDTGRGGAAELRAEAPGAVPVLDLLLRLHPVCALRRLLERLCLQPAGRATAAAAMTHSLEAGTGRRSHFIPPAVTSRPPGLKQVTSASNI